MELIIIRLPNRKFLKEMFGLVWRIGLCTLGLKGFGKQEFCNRLTSLKVLLVPKRVLSTTLFTKTD